MPCLCTISVIRLDHCWIHFQISSVTSFILKGRHPIQCENNFGRRINNTIPCFEIILLHSFDFCFSVPVFLLASVSSSNAGLSGRPAVVLILLV